VAGAYLRVEDGTLHGVATSAYNDVRGTQRGLTIGLLNRAYELHGLQIGILNYAGNRPAALRWLPVVNWNFGDGQ
jgi:hypothetical protein